MNLENLEKLAQWLEDGAPHVHFSLDYDICTREELEDEFEDIVIERGQIPDPDCGTICCIAGAAVLMAEAPEGQLFPSFGKQERLADEPWSVIEDKAAEFLGLEVSPHPLSMFAVKLFDPDLAPTNCTPKQAAQAVRRVMKGEPAW